MPSETQPQDVSIRTPISFRLPLEHVHFHEAPARCRSPCCAPLAASQQSPAPSGRPALNRNAASHHSARSGRSSYSMGTDGASSAQSDSGAGAGAYLYSRPDIIDMSVFEQILEMDDDPQEHDFSKTIVTEFFEQAKNTFESLDDNLENRDLGRLSDLGHFLKGSSATLGLTKLQRDCEKIQNFGKRKDASGIKDEPDDDKSLQNCRSSIVEAKAAFDDAERLLKTYFDI